MISLIPSKILGPALVLISSAMLLPANSALAAQPDVDSQELARQFILGRPTGSSVADSNTKPTTTTSASDCNHVDLQGQVRGFILAKPEFGSAIDGNTEVIAATDAAARNDRLDPQELVRQFILAGARPTFPAVRVTVPVSAAGLHHPLQIQEAR